MLLILPACASRNSFSPAGDSRYNSVMKYSLRSLMIVVLVGPPLLAWGWLLLARFMTPRELVYPDQGRWPVAVSWEKATAEVRAAEIERLQKMLPNSSALAPIPPKE